MRNNFNIETAIETFNCVEAETGSFSIIDKGFEILPDEYLDFWRWLFDDRDFYEDDALCRIAGYVSSEEVRINKRKLYEYVKSSAVGVAWELPELCFYEDVPHLSYEECRKRVAVVVEQRQRQRWEELCEWNRKFHKFVCSPLSMRFLMTRNRKELQLFFRSIDRQILMKALVLYTPMSRMTILHCHSDRIKREILESLKHYVRGSDFLLTECVEAESIIHSAIEKFWQLEISGSLQEYMQERKTMIAKVREVSGKKDFIIPYNLSVKRYDGGIILKINPVNVDFSGMTHVYDIDWRYPITQYAFILYKYVLDEQGQVFVDMEGRKELPVYDIKNSSKQEDYFLFLYRLMKLEKCYKWIVLSDIIKKAVRTFEQNLISFKRSGDSFIEVSYKKAFRNRRREYRNLINYYERIRKSLCDSGRLLEVLKNVTEESVGCEDINRDFTVNLYRGEYKFNNRCCHAEAFDFWIAQKDMFYGMNLYNNAYDSMIEKVFFYANYLGDLLEGGLFEDAGWVDEELYNVKNALVLVLTTEQQNNVFFKDWMKFSENVVEKVKIMWKNVQ